MILAALDVCDPLPSYIDHVVIMKRVRESVLDAGDNEASPSKKKSKQTEDGKSLSTLVSLLKEKDSLIAGYLY